MIKIHGWIQKILTSHILALRERVFFWNPLLSNFFLLLSIFWVIIKDDHEVVYVSNDGKKYTKNDPGYKLATLSFLGAAHQYASSFIHGVSHYHINDPVATVVMNMPNKDSSILFKLLFPHIRYSLAVNDASLVSSSQPFESVKS